MPIGYCEMYLYEVPTVAWVEVMANLGTQYKNEAQEVLEQNTVVFNQNTKVDPDRWLTMTRRFKSFSFVYASSDLDNDCRMEIQETIRWCEPTWPLMDWQSRCEVLHEAQQEALNDEWGNREVSLLGDAVDYLEIGVSEAYCPNGCCRMAEEACLSIHLDCMPVKVEFIGAIDEDERRSLLSILEDNAKRETPSKPS